MYGANLQAQCRFPDRLLKAVELVSSGDRHWPVSRISRSPPGFFAELALAVGLDRCVVMASFVIISRDPIKVGKHPHANESCGMRVRTCHDRSRICQQRLVERRFPNRPAPNAKSMCTSVFVGTRGNLSAI